MWLWSQRNKLNELCMLHTNIEALGHVVSDKIFFRFPNISLCKICEPWGRGIFGTGSFLAQSNNLNIIGEGLLDDASYQIY